MKSNSYRWYVVAIFFVFTLLHQTDRLLIGPLTEKIKADFTISGRPISDAQMGAISTGALIVGAVCYPLWGYLYDRFARTKLLALASFLWGATTWLNARAHSYPALLITRSSTGIDDSSYPGLYSLIADYFGPEMRGKVYGILQITQPLGYLLGMVLGLMLSDQLGWRGVFYITGSLGILLAAVIYFGVKEPSRGQSEPEMAGVETLGIVRFNWKTARDLFKKPSLVLLFIQGFFGVFPWNAITFWIFAYMERERGYSGETMLVIMAFVIVLLAAGYPLGGALGDWLFKRTLRGRVMVAATGVIIGAFLFWITLEVPAQNQASFMVMLSLTAIFIPIASSNVISTVYDITLPEVRSTALAVESFIESAGAALSPLLVGLISDVLTLKDAFLIICVGPWIICAIFFVFTAYLVPRDIAVLRNQMRIRAESVKQDG